MIEIVDRLPDNNLEKKYFNDIALVIKDRLLDLNMNSVYPEISEIVLKNFGEDIDYKENSLVLMNADEQYRIPSEYYNPNVKFIFKQYSYHNCNKMLGIPLGCPSDFGVKRRKEFQSRKIDFSFVGQIGNRDDVYQLVKKISNFKANSFIGFTKGFNSGLNKDIYYEILHDSKIVICPRGASSFESFRLYEAAYSGAIVLCAPQPKNWIYLNNPFTEYKDLDDLILKLSFILEKNEYEKAILANKCLSFYEENWKANMVSQKILNFLIESKYLKKDPPLQKTNFFQSKIQYFNSLFR
jgi:hypothetical protein